MKTRVIQNEPNRPTEDHVVPAILASDLTKRFGTHQAVDHLSFEVPFGTVMGFLGPNGAGKTTTFRMLLGLMDPSEGFSTILGQPYERIAEPGRSVGALLDSASFHPRRTGRNHLRIHATAAGIPVARIDELLLAVDLVGAADRKVGEYSLGMRQRLGLAVALLGDPRVLILDEPANGLDPAGHRWLRDLLRTEAENGRAVFVSSHVLAELAQFADQVIVIDRGKLVIQSTVEHLLAGAAGSVRVRTPQPGPLVDALQRSGLVATPAEHEWLDVTGGTIEHIGTIAAAEGVTLYGLETHSQTLEDVFLELTNSEVVTSP